MGLGLMGNFSSLSPAYHYKEGSFELRCILLVFASISWMYYWGVRTNTTAMVNKKNTKSSCISSSLRSSFRSSVRSLSVKVAGPARKTFPRSIFRTMTWIRCFI